VVVGGDARVERAGGPERDREDRPEAVDRVVGEQDRDVQARLLDGDPLVLVDERRVGEAEDAADRLRGLLLVDLPVGEQLDLVQLLVEVILASSRSTRRSMPRSGAPRFGASAASSVDCVAATTPPATAVLSTTVASPASTLRLRVLMVLPRLTGAG
jgi:hypothetical protein